MSSLGDRMRKAREHWIPYLHMEFLVRVPTTTQMQLMLEESWSVVAARCVVDWRNVSEKDLGFEAEDSVPFDADAFTEFVGNEPKLAGDVARLIQEKLMEVVNKQEEVGKKSE